MLMQIKIGVYYNVYDIGQRNWCIYMCTYAEYKYKQLYSGKDRRTDSQTNRQSGKQTVRQTDSQANRQSGKQTGIQVNRQTDRQTGKQKEGVRFSV